MQTKKDQSFGFVPLFKTEDGYLFCLVQHTGEHWGFPKGHSNEGESERESAKRELAEETGILDINIIEEVYFSQNYSFEKDGTIYDKSVKYFLGLVGCVTSEVPEEFKSEISQIKWLPYDQARNLITYENAKEVLDNAHKYLTSK